jgi:hypothetical protein
MPLKFHPGDWQQTTNIRSAMKGGHAMQRKKRLPRKLGYATILSITMLILFVMCGGQKNLTAEESVPFPYLYVKWEKIEPLKLPDTLPDGGKLVTIKFISSKGGIFVSNSKGVKMPYCARITETGSIIENKCKSLMEGSAVVGIGKKTNLITQGSPYCVSETFGGYVMEYDAVTGESPCPRN